MELKDYLRVLRRRWYVVLVIWAAVAAIHQALVKQEIAVYESQVEIVIKEPQYYYIGGGEYPLPWLTISPETRFTLMKSEPVLRKTVGYMWVKWQQFKDVFEFCDNTQKQFSQSARQSLHHFFHGPFHLALPASRVAIGRPGTLEAGRPIGAALVLAQEEGWALLDMIFVKPTWRRRGLATALAAAALTALHEQGGYRTLVSRYHLGNEPSRAWHHNFGFADEPDLRLAQLHLRAAIHELRRLRESGQLTSQENRRLNRERARWQKEADRLEALVKAGREDEADPWRKWRRKPRDDEMIVLKKPAVPQQKDV